MKEIWKKYITDIWNKWNLKGTKKNKRNLKVMI